MGLAVNVNFDSGVWAGTIASGIRPDRKPFFRRSRDLRYSVNDFVAKSELKSGLG